MDCIDLICFQRQASLTTTVERALRVFLPRALSIIGEVPDAAWSCVPIEEAWKHVGNVARISRRRGLVANGRDRFGLTRALNHVIDKTGAIGTEDPRNTHNDVCFI